MAWVGSHNNTGYIKQVLSPFKKNQNSVMSCLYIDSVFSLSSIFALIFLLSTMAKRETGNDTAHKRKPQLALVSNRKCALSGHF